MSKDLAKVERLYHVMVELLNQPKTIDVMRKMPAQVKDGEVLDFNGRSFGGAGKPDGFIFGGQKEFDRVCNTQAVTHALKRDYTKALKEWIDGTTVEEPKKETKAKKSSKADANRPEPTIEDTTPTDLVGRIKELLSDDKVKKAKKLLKESKDEDGYKKAKKLVKAMEE